jgi:hypothetical protein
MHTEFEVRQLENDILSIVAGQDLITYHEAEIRFHGVQAIAGKLFWMTDAHGPCIELIDGTEEAFAFNVANWVEVGHSIFKLPNNDGHAFVVAAKRMEFVVEAVKH